MMSLKGRKGMERIRVSGCIMTQGAPELLAGCLEDMAFADEIIVVDGGPDDGCGEGFYGSRRLSDHGR